jgi:hypothetical protein
VDGTFFVTPKPFYQLYIIHAFVKHGELEKQVSELKFIDLILKLNTYVHIYIFKVPLAFILMSHKREMDCVAVFEEILKLVTDEDKG